MATDQTGYIQFPDITDRFTVVLMNWYNDRFKVTGNDGKAIEAKVGSFDIVDIRLFRNDENGVAWSTRTILPMGIKIKTGETTVITGVTGPERAAVRASTWAPGYYSFSFTMEDSKNNRYSYFRRNDIPLPNPVFVIEDADGNVLFQGHFEPG